MRTTKAQREAEDRLRAAFDAGVDYFAEHPELMMAEVHRLASSTFAVKSEALEFALGYVTERNRRDDYRRENRDDPN